MLTTWWVYLIRNDKGLLYTGIAKDPHLRLKVHNSGRGAKFTKGRGPWSHVYLQEFPDHRRAAKEELRIKSLTRSQKLLLCSGWFNQS